MLHEIEPNGLYCAPAVLMAITGLNPKGEIRSALNRAKGRRDNAGIIGVHTHELEKAMDDLGIHWIKNIVFHQNLSKFCSFIDHRCSKWIIEVTGHYVAMENGVIFDNRIRYGCDVAEHPCKRMKVHKAYQIL